MGKVVNLRQAKKRKAREEQAARGDANAALHGVDKATKELERARSEKAARDLEAHRRDD